MKKKLSSILICLTFLIGLGIMLYPMISNLYSEHNQIQTINNYEKVIEDMNDNEIQEAIELARKYNKRLIGNVTLTDPFDAELQKELDSEYEHLLNIDGDGIMGHVNIPEINVNLPIYHGTSEEVLQKGVGHLENTSLPVGGEDTHTVLSGHTGLPSAELFNKLSELEEGDEFYLHILGKVLAYKIDQIKVVEPENTSDLLIDPTKDYATLVTCTPYGVNSHRLLVRGIRIPYVENMENEQVTTTSGKAREWLSEYVNVLVVGISAILVVVASIWLISIKKRKNEGEK